MGVSPLHDAGADVLSSRTQALAYCQPGLRTVAAKEHASHKTGASGVTVQHLSAHQAPRDRHRFWETAANHT